MNDDVHVRPKPGAARVGGDAQVNFGKSFAKAAQARRKPAVGEARLRHYGKLAAAPAQARAFPAQRVQRPGNSAVKAFPVRRQAYARRVADKQRKPEIFLKMPDMLADRRLGHAQFFPRSGEAAGSGRCLKGGKCIQGRGIKHKKNLS